MRLLGMIVRQLFLIMSLGIIMVLHRMIKVTPLQVMMRLFVGLMRVWFLVLIGRSFILRNCQ